MKTMIKKMLETLKQLLVRIEKRTDERTKVFEKPEKSVNTENQVSSDHLSKRNWNQTMTIPL